MSAGRPSKYKPEYCAAIIEHCKEGMSRESFAAVVDVNRDTLHEWKEKHLEFSDAWSRCKEYRQKTLEKLVLDHAKGKNKGSTAAAIFMLKNIAPESYKDRSEVQHVSPDKLSLEDLKKEAAALLEELNESQN